MRLCQNDKWRLKAPLGRWFRSSDHHPFLFCPEQREILVNMQDSSILRYVAERRSRRCRYIRDGYANGIPDTARPATCSWANGCLRITGHRAFVDQYISEPQQQWACEASKAVAGAIKDGTAIAVSDGSYKNGWATAAWILQTGTNGHEITGSDVVPGTSRDQSAFRAEAFGILSTINLAINVCKSYRTYCIY